MSPRAAWQLEELGFDKVHDFVAGKAEWTSHGFPLEGRGPHFPLVGEEARREGLEIWAPEDSAAEVVLRVTEGDGYCVVVNQQGVLLGKLRRDAIGNTTSGLIREVMEPGPTTVRPTESAQKLLERMQKRRVPSILVTTNKGNLVGVASREDLEALVRGA